MTNDEPSPEAVAFLAMLEGLVAALPPRDVVRPDPVPIDIPEDVESLPLLWTNHDVVEDADGIPTAYEYTTTAYQLRITDEVRRRFRGIT